VVRVAEADKSVEPTPEETLQQRVRAFVRLKNTVKALTEQQDTIKKGLASLVETNGDVDEDGSQWLNLPAEVEGYNSLKRERRVSRTLDMDAAERLLREKGLYDECIVMAPTVDEDALMTALVQDRLTAEDIDTIYTTKVTYAFVPQKKAY
jgi:hypothetical protein